MRRFRKIAPNFFSPVFLARLFFIIVMTFSGMELAPLDKYPISLPMVQGFVPVIWVYTSVAFLVSILLVLFEYATSAVSSHKILMAALGALSGLIFATLFYRTIPEGIVRPESAQMVCNLFFGYFGVIMALKHADRFHLSRLKTLLSQEEERPKILDSSVIIDGRIRELIEMLVVRGTIVVPEFVIHEIQAIADSNDSGRKARGRRGLEVMQGLREICRGLELVDRDFPEIPSVDQKLIRLSREMHGDLITNDFNLQKIAQLHQITVININEIANALRPMVYIGEILTLNIVREGKEHGQGVGYLDDGTMVVVDDARPMLGQEVGVTVSSILQTSSGRLVFARLREESGLMRA